MSGLAHGASAAVPHGMVPRRIVRQEDGSQYRRLYYWRLMAHRTRHLVRTLIEPTSNHNPYYTYARVFADFYQPLLDLWYGAPAEEEGELSAEEENLQAVLDSVEVDEFGAITLRATGAANEVRHPSVRFDWVEIHQTSPVGLLCGISRSTCRPAIWPVPRPCAWSGSAAALRRL